MRIALTQILTVTNLFDALLNEQRHVIFSSLSHLLDYKTKELHNFLRGTWLISSRLWQIERDLSMGMRVV